MRRLALSIALLSLGLPAVSSASGDGEIRLDAELGYAGFADTRRYHGMFAALDAAYAFGDSLGIKASYGFGLHRSKNAAFESHQLSTGLRYRLDVFHYVPWIDLAPVVHLVGGGGERGPGEGAHFGVAAGLGFDRLLDPDWSVGFAARYHQLFDQERFPAYLTLAIRLGYRWSLGDPFAP